MKNKNIFENPLTKPIVIFHSVDEKPLYPDAISKKNIRASNFIRVPWQEIFSQSTG